jgi:predicted short-subunit dehydrogenase-like oxidoreductase (DUF2520 family)
MERINIIGCGRAAGSLARLWQQAECVEIGAVMNRSLESSQQAVFKIGAGTAARSLEQFPPARYWLIGASDEQISPIARALAKTSLKMQDSCVFHLCGRHGSDILGPLQSRGCLIAAVHPVRSLTHNRIRLDDFADTACVAEGGQESLQVLQSLFLAIGGLWMPVSELDRGLYHAAVSIISNITKSVTWKAQNWLVNSGLTADMAAQVTQKLLSSTLEDVSRSGARQSITGPVVRGDTSTVEAHIRALHHRHPEDVEVYRVLARTVLELARERGDLDEQTLGRFEAILAGSVPDQT